jgi:hypothetical protein
LGEIGTIKKVIEVIQNIAGIVLPVVVDSGTRNIKESNSDAFLQNHQIRVQRFLPITPTSTAAAASNSLDVLI